MPIRAVFFDAGETLVHPHPSFPDLFSEILSREGHALDPELVAEVLEVSVRTVKRDYAAARAWLHAQFGRSSE